MLRSLASTVEQLSAALQRTRKQAEELESDTEANAEEAQEHGWDGVAYNNQQAGQALDVLIEVIGTARRTATETLETLGPGLGVTPVAGRLRDAVEHLALLKHAVDAAIGPCEEAARSTQIAGMNALAGDLERLHAELTEAAETVERALTRAESEVEAPAEDGRALLITSGPQLTAVVRTPQQLAEALSSALQRGLPATVAVQAEDQPEPAIEVRVDHPVRATLIWRAEDTEEQASDPSLPPVEEQPDSTLDDVQYILEVFLRDGTRAEGYEWI